MDDALVVFPHSVLGFVERLVQNFVRTVERMGVIVTSKLNAAMIA